MSAGAAEHGRKPVCDSPTPPPGGALSIGGAGPVVALLAFGIICGTILYAVGRLVGRESVAEELRVERLTTSRLRAELAAERAKRVELAHDLRWYEGMPLVATDCRAEPAQVGVRH